MTPRTGISLGRINQSYVWRLLGVKGVVDRGNNRETSAGAYYQVSCYRYGNESAIGLEWLSPYDTLVRLARSV